MKFKFNLENILIILLLGILAVVVGLNIYNILNSENNQSQASSISFSGGEDMVRIKDCFYLQEGKQKCMDDFIAAYFGEKTTKEVLADLEQARLRDTEIENQCHPVAHAVGRITYLNIGNVGDAFESCDQSCHSGCYHGVMERLFYGDDEIIDENKHLTYGDMVLKIPGICNSDKFKNPSNAVIFQCLHGVGHAILYSLNYNLEDALKSCDLLSTQYEKSSCYGGVIMENITAFDKKKRDINPADALYPCNKLDEKYKAECFVMQTSLMFEYGLTVDLIEKECEKSGIYKSQCFTSLGRDLSNYVRTGNIEYVVKSCEEFSSNFEASCINGVSFALIDNTWDARFAFKFCNALTKDANKQTCFINSNSYLQWSYSKTKTEVEEQCKLYARDDLSLCLSNVT